LAIAAPLSLVIVIELVTPGGKDVAALAGFSAMFCKKRLQAAQTK
jgi:hypothetical protein